VDASRKTDKNTNTRKIIIYRTRYRFRSRFAPKHIVFSIFLHTAINIIVVQTTICRLILYRRRTCPYDIVSTVSNINNNLLLYISSFLVHVARLMVFGNRNDFYDDRKPRESQCVLPFPGHTRQYHRLNITILSPAAVVVGFVTRHERWPFRFILEILKKKTLSKRFEKNTVCTECQSYVVLYTERCNRTIWRTRPIKRHINRSDL